MKHTEVKIGNKVDLYGSIATIQLEDFRKGLAITEGKPIPLTEDWLLKFGFKHRKCGVSGADMWQGLDFWDKECDMAYLTLRGSLKYGLKIQGFINSEIKHVHSLQNLYFALTQIELKLN